jgi:hypothetical protein
LNLKFKLEDWSKFSFASQIKVNNNVNLGISTGLEVSKDGVKNIVGKNSFSLPVGFSLEFSS